MIATPSGRLAVDSSDRLLMQFLVHDNLAVVRAATATLRQVTDLPWPPDPSRRGALEAARDSLERLSLQLTDMLLAFGDDRPDPHAHVPLDLAEIVRQVVDGLDPAGHEVVTVVQPAPALGDAELLTRAIANLVANAVIHTPWGTTVTVSTTTGGGQAMIAVDDDGPGISDALKTSILAPFNRGQAPSWVTGLGLGMSLVHVVADRHGGRVDVHDSTSGGARFVLSIPAVAS